MIKVVEIPPLATVQDLGRDGHWSQGLGRAGAMDALSHKVANMLLGNSVDRATLEIPLTPAKFRFTADTTFALVGAACGARLDGRRLPRIWAGPAKAGQTLKLATMTSGARVYLALPRGIDVPEILGSRSTQLREAFGGLEGRVLAAGDELRGDGEVDLALPEYGLSCASPSLTRAEDKSIEVRALPSTEYESFTESSRKAFWSTPYRITPQSNRQGYRLEGAPLDLIEHKELRSHGIAPGIVQVPGGAQPIIQLADAATMGGYPKIAAVIEPDLWRIAQSRPGDQLRFVEVDLTTAAEAAAEQEHWLSNLQNQLSCTRAQLRSWL